MKRFILLLCLFGVALAVRQDKKINLEDIERDNLKSERKVKQEKQESKAAFVQPQLQTQQTSPQFAFIQQPPQLPQYSFLPVKTPQNYAQQQTFIPQQQQYQQYYSAIPQQRQYEALDNNIGHQASYYSQQPQYVYYQPAAAPQHLEPRATPTVQYVMYIPAAAATSPAAAYVASPKTETLLHSAQEYLNALPLPQTYATQQYTYDLPAPQRYVQQEVKYQYVQASQEPAQVTEPTPEAPPQQQYVSAPVGGQEQPKSLLDSYVPSYLQVQYYKQKQQQQQAQRNSIEDDGKVTGKVVSSSIRGKTNVVKSQQGSESTYHHQYQIPEYE